ncbi:MAG: hypothetical protein MK102_10390 [Fuerstiella sp.]|nr:hypothetical protein [Fuerstiella sp.]
MSQTAVSSQRPVADIQDREDRRVQLEFFHWQTDQITQCNGHSIAYAVYAVSNDSPTPVTDFGGHAAIRYVTPGRGNSRIKFSGASGLVSGRRE